MLGKRNINNCEESEQKKQNINFKSEQNCKEFVAKVPFDINSFDKKVQINEIL